MTNGHRTCVLVAAIVAAGCSGRRPVPDRAPAAAPAPPVALAVERVVDLTAADRHAPPRIPPLERRCGPKVSGGPRPDGHGYELAATFLRPIPSGPRTVERAREAIPRGRTPFESALERHRGLHDCYRWARVRSPEWEGTIATRLEVDEQGQVDWVQTIAPERDLAPLRACVSDVLMGLRPLGATPRRTIALVSLDFHRRGLGPPPPTLRRPAAEPRNATERCLPLPARSPVDLLELGSFSVDDFDGEQAEMEREAKARDARRAWERGGRRGPEPEPYVRTRAARDEHLATVISYREQAGSAVRSFAYNRGAYQRCYADAFARHPGLAGRLAVRIEFTAEGEVAEATIPDRELSTTDPELTSCMLDAARTQWLETMGGEGPVTVILPMVLTPEATARPAVDGVPTVTAVERYAQEALARGWAETALHAYATLVEQGGDHPRRCHWHAGALRAALEVAPWVDERALRAADELLAHAAAHRAEEPTSACLTAASTAIARVFLEPYERGHDDGAGVRLHPDYARHYLELARERYRSLIRRAPFVTEFVRAPDDVATAPRLPD